MEPNHEHDPQLLRAALGALGEGISLADARGRIFYSNPAADRILGVTATDTAPETWAQYYGVFVPGTETPFPTEEYPLVRALAGEKTDDVLMFIRNRAVPDGALISVTGRPVGNGDGTIKGAAVVFRDVTELKEAESGLRTALTRLEEAQEQKSELVGFLVHDMKSPLTAIIAGAQLLMSSGLKGEDKQDLTAIMQSAQTLHRMVLDLLDIQVGEDGHLGVQSEEISLSELFRTAAAGVKPRGAIVIIDCPTAHPVHADASLLQRVVANLVDNCIKYGPRGGRIWLEGQSVGDGRTVIRVRDEGPGVPPELREAIFERYAQVERASGHRREGSRGLGLRFCKVAVEAHGGRIWVEDGHPQGAVFCVELPPPHPANP
ncbi:MAG: ATP-binding protein [Gemmatimonadota bacterium]